MKALKRNSFNSPEKGFTGALLATSVLRIRTSVASVKKDAVNEYIEKMTTAQGIVLGSPSNFQDVTAEMKVLIDRAGFVGLANGRMYKNKIGVSWHVFAVPEGCIPSKP